jgi:hypothetical protein
VAVRGVFFEIPEEPDAQRAARELSNVMLAKYASVPLAWVAAPGDAAQVRLLAYFMPEPASGDYPR